MKTLLVVAGEASGDLQGGPILKALKELHPDLRIVGVGGERMSPYLDRKVADVSQLSVMGLFEVIPHIPFFLRLKRDLVRLAQEEDCVGALLIDYQGFNKSLARKLREVRPAMQLCQYVCPQVWAWKPGRIPGVGALFDVLYCLFPFEPPLFAGHKVEAVWLGHPLLDRLAPEMDEAAFLQAHGLDPQRPRVALLPGSRRGELAHNLPPLKGLVKAWSRDPGRRHVQWVLPLAPGIAPETVRAALGDLPVVLVERAGNAARAYADAALVCSGTATLETALLGVPFALLYRMNPITYAIGKRLVKLPHVGLASIVAGREVAPELLQEQVTPENLGRALDRLLDPAQAAAMRKDLATVREQMGEAGAAARIAAHLASRIY